MHGPGPHQPSLEEFRELARRYRVVPVWRELLADLTTPVAAFARVVGDGDGFLLESVEHSERWSRWSFIGRNPIATLVARGPNVEAAGQIGVDIPRDRGMLAALEVLLEHCRAPSIEGLPPLHGGLIGYLGYDVVREVEHLPDAPPDDSGLADAVMSLIGELAVYDHWRQRVTLICNVQIPSGADDRLVERLYFEAVLRVDALAADGAKSLDEPLMPPPDPVSDAGREGAELDTDLPETVSTMSPEHYARAVEAVREHIFAGDAFQVVLSQRFDFELDAEAFDVYRVLRQINPSPYMYFLRHDGLEVAGSSPEPMVKLLDGRVISRPIAGTRRRGATEAEDRFLAAELAEHPKELAEHVMLVDLARNDIGRVIEFGTLNLDESMTVERYSHVMHLTSQVSGEMAATASAVDVLRATLPAGTVSGAPKVRAMEIIDALEPAKRGIYAGVVGYIDFSGNIDTAIAIRTMVVRDGRASVQAGAGIVADSAPADEHAECVNKARALLAAVPAARRMTRARRHGSGKV
ncbi:MAG: anthranilate synthase component I [Acidimicrobiaceae bacterium]|nr:anthranilate synthase component I [Acidimicrobiaceae bacterium]